MCVCGSVRNLLARLFLTKNKTWADNDTRITAVTNNSTTVRVCVCVAIQINDNPLLLAADGSPHEESPRSMWISSRFIVVVHSCTRVPLTLLLLLMGMLMASRFQPTHRIAS